MQKKLWQKVVLMLVLTLVLLIPLNMIKNLVNERAYRQQEVINEITASSSGSQKVFGPILAMPYQEQWQEIIETHSDGELKRETVQRIERKVMYFQPEQLHISGALETETKQRGLFKVRSYVLGVDIKGNFDLAENYSPKPQHNGEITFGQPYASVMVSDMRGLIEAPGLEWQGKQYSFEQGAELPIDKIKGMHASLDKLPVGSGVTSIPFAFALKLRGTESLDFIPVGKHTSVELSSAWQHPSFYGRFLPEQQTQQIDEHGFRAHWNVEALASNVTESLNKGRDINVFDSFGVRLMEPINIYSLSDRATKYGFLFVCLTFAAIFLFETIKRMAIHPAQYAFVGLALAMFFLLLLSLSEHIAFVGAYCLASSACVTLIGCYLSAVLHSHKRGLAAGALLAGLFASLYGLLESEDNALMLGSLLLFALLSLAMMSTRRIDWYSLTPERNPQELSNKISLQ